MKSLNRDIFVWPQQYKKTASHTQLESNAFQLLRRMTKRVVRLQEQVDESSTPKVVGAIQQVQIGDFIGTFSAASSKFGVPANTIRKRYNCGIRGEQLLIPRRGSRANGA